MASRSTPTSPSRRTTDEVGPPSATHPRLRIRLDRHGDGAVVLEMRRADGTRTWQKRSGPTAEFFAVHDLTHYAVETTLGATRGFYGLVADGWALADFGTPWPRGRLPDEALAVELIVGYLDGARATGAALSADACSQAATAHFAAAERDVSIRITAAQLALVGERVDALLRRWHGATTGNPLELDFPYA